MGFNQYPILFTPIFKERIWGGEKIRTVLNKDISSSHTGESWEISSVEGDVSVVASGEYKGWSIVDLVNQFPKEVLGEAIYRRFGKQFPLLFKFLDAKEDLSIQLHPNDALAKERHNSFGKTEMWYVMQADEGARVVVDFKDGVTANDYLHHLSEKTLPSILKEIPVKEGDVFFIETGTVHAIGKGVLLAEIQQNSDITYRVYDWDRKDANGAYRELHVDLALDAINYAEKVVELPYEKKLNAVNAIVKSDFFTVNFLPVQGEYIVEKSNDRFYLYVCLKGSCKLKIEGVAYEFTKGDTILIPASIENIEITGDCRLLEIFVP